jgi:uncharacterized circularly permuted ATP-grasp superfamily protein
MVPLSVLRHVQRQLATLHGNREMASMQAQVDHLRNDVRRLEAKLESRFVVALHSGEFASSLWGSGLLGVTMGATLCFVVMARNPR